LGGGNGLLIWKGAAKRAQELGYSLEAFTIHGDPSHGRKLSDVLVSRGIRGIILGYHRGNSQEIDMKWENFSIVGISNYFPGLLIHRIMSNAVHMIRLAVSKLEEKGCRRIALSIPEKGNILSDSQFSGEYMNYYSRQFSKNRIPPFINPPDMWTKDRFQKWLCRYRPDGLIGFGFDAAAWLNEDGRAPGKDIEFVELGLLPDNSHPHHGIDQQPYRGGQIVVETLVHQINTNQTGMPACPILTMLEPEWIEGTSSRKHH